MTKNSRTKLLLRAPLFLQIAIACPSVASADILEQPSPEELRQATQINTLMCTTESCTESDENTPGCKQYTTPLNTCYNAHALFPGDESWSDLDIYDEMVMLNLKRTFYQSKNGSCVGRGEEEDGSGAASQPVDGDDSFILPMGTCVGPFGDPRPWGKFTLMNEEESEIVTSKH